MSQEGQYISDISRLHPTSYPCGHQVCFPCPKHRRNETEQRCHFLLVAVNCFLDIFTGLYSAVWSFTRKPQTELSLQEILLALKQEYIRCCVRSGMIVNFCKRRCLPGSSQVEHVHGPPLWTAGLCVTTGALLYAAVFPTHPFLRSPGGFSPLCSEVTLFICLLPQLNWEKISNE